MVLLLKAQYDKNFLHQDRAMALLRNTVPAKVSMQRNFVLNSKLQCYINRTAKLIR